MCQNKTILIAARRNSLEIASNFLFNSHTQNILVIISPHFAQHPHEFIFKTYIHRPKTIVCLLIHIPHTCTLSSQSCACVTFVNKLYFVRCLSVFFVLFCACYSLGCVLLLECIKANHLKREHKKCVV